VQLLPGVRSREVATDRLRVHLLEAGREDGVPVVLVHGNLSTARFLEHVLAGAPPRYRMLAPDMRGFGDTEPLPIDATRGMADWADDVDALLRALGITRPAHLVGWSAGGGAVATYALQRAAASLTLICPVSPYGFGGVRPDGTPCYPDYAGSGAGTASPDFIERLRTKDRSRDAPASPRNVMTSAYWAPTHREPPEREELLLDELLKTRVGDGTYPGDARRSGHWPGVAPGTRGILNALSPKYCRWAGIVDVEPKPPILWTHGTADSIVADGSAFELGTLGKLGHVPGWPGDDAFPPQPMVTQIRTVLERYGRAGGRVEIELFEGSGHCPAIDAADRWRSVFFGFLDSLD
jgi:pimeloyl-ACP methyl ester carboxylesterase